jgi:hypothetical protein
MRYLIIIFCIVAFFGCSSRKTVSTTTVTTEKDSTYVREIPRNMEVKIERDTVTITEYIECDSVTNKPKPMKIEKHSTRASIDINIDQDGKITATSECDSLNAIIEVKDREIYRLTLKETKETTVTEKGRVFPWWGWLLVGFLLGVICMLILKVYLRI